MSPSWAKIGLQVPLSDDNTGCLSITDTQLESHKIKNHHRGFLTVETDISLWATQDLQTNHLVATVLCDLAAPGKRHAETGPGPTLSPTALRVVPGALILAQGPRAPSLYRSNCSICASEASTSLEPSEPQRLEGHNPGKSENPHRMVRGQRARSPHVQAISGTRGHFPQCPKIQHAPMDLAAKKPGPGNVSLAPDLCP